MNIDQSVVDYNNEQYLLMNNIEPMKKDFVYETEEKNYVFKLEDHISIKIDLVEYNDSYKNLNLIK